MTIEKKMAAVPPDTHSDEELMSPEFRAGVETLKHAIRMAVLSSQGNPDVGTYWVAIHELAKEVLLADKGEEQAAVYWEFLRGFARWQFAREGFPLDEVGN